MMKKDALQGIICSPGKKRLFSIQAVNTVMCVSFTSIL